MIRIAKSMPYLKRVSLTSLRISKSKSLLNWTEHHIFGWSLLKLLFLLYSLGAGHDGTSNNCNPGDNYLMAPVHGTHGNLTNFHYLSPCSIAEIKKELLTPEYIWFIFTHKNINQEIIILIIWILHLNFVILAWAVCPSAPNVYQIFQRIFRLKPLWQANIQLARSGHWTINVKWFTELMRRSVE